MKQTKKATRRRPLILGIVLAWIALLAAVGGSYSVFGGFGTGRSADVQELKRYAGTVADITLPDEAEVIALGEATHGNAEFQQLKLEVFRHLVEAYDVRAFVLEGDYGGCEQANRYIHGGEGTAAEAAQAIGFAIYRTEQMRELLDYMRTYNETAPKGKDLRFYGNDMQRVDYSVKFLAETYAKYDSDSSEIAQMADENGWTDVYDLAQCEEIVTKAKRALKRKQAPEQAIRCADMLLQNLALSAIKDDPYGAKWNKQRDLYMADNLLWIRRQERSRGNRRIFLAAHNGHVAHDGSMNEMGKQLTKELGASYVVIGTDFYKTRCNLPVNGRRTVKTFYSRDPIAKAAKRAGLDICYLDFAQVPASSALYGDIHSKTHTGSLGEGYSFLYRLLPRGYRIFRPQSKLYDGMIYVAEATPTVIDE